MTWLRIRLWLLLTCAFGGCSSVAGAACEISKPIACSRSTTADLLEKEIAGLEEKMFEIQETVRVSVIDRDDFEEFVSELEMGSEYAIVAACGDKCSQVKLALTNEQQQQVAAIDEKQQVVILNGSVPAKGLYSLIVSAPGCAQSFCGVGVLIMRKKMLQ